MTKYLVEPQQQDHCVVHNTVYSGNSERLNSEQSLISEHFW